MNINLILTKVTAEQGGSRPSKLVKLRHNELEVERCENIVIVATTARAWPDTGQKYSYSIKITRRA